MTSSKTIFNFGKNVRFAPRYRYEPRTEAEVLAILNRHQSGQIRVVGARHSWSELVPTEDATVDMRHFAHVKVCRAEAGIVQASVGGGCRIKDLLRTLRNDAQVTMPSIGLITEQTIAGAISTGTHGSGRHSLSHYVTSVRAAAYDHDSGAARIYEIDGGVELRAARCALGCVGIILEVRFRCVPEFSVRETLTQCDSLDHALRLEDEAPLQQFYLIPHLWRYYAQQRQIVQPVARSFAAPLYRLYWRLAFDVGLHLCIKAGASVFRSRLLIRRFFRHAFPRLVLTGWSVIDKSHRHLVMKHELFRHFEMELFVRRDQLAATLHFLKQVLQVFDGTRCTLTNGLRTLLSEEHRARLEAGRGVYTHHYPICIRKILPDDTLISMSSGSDTWYSISLITFVEPRTPFVRLAQFLAETTGDFFDSRLHWGKFFPLGAEQVKRAYPPLDDFRAVCDRLDRNGVFRNDFVARILELPSIANEKGAT